MLDGLDSLSITCSEIDRQLDEVLKLTNLTCLDLTHVWPHRRLQGEAVSFEQPWISFKAWPALKVYKFAHCWVIDSSTDLDIATVEEVYTNRLAAAMEIGKLHLILRRKHDDMLVLLASLSSPTWCTHIVDLHLIVTYLQDTTIHLASAVEQVIEAVVSLQTFHLRLCYGKPDSHAQNRIVLGSGYSGQLQSFELENMPCKTLNLGSATCLRSISVVGVDSDDMPCELALPSGVVQLKYFGNTLFNLAPLKRESVLKQLSCLAQVTLGTCFQYSDGTRQPEVSASMPRLPWASSLRCLKLRKQPVKWLLDDSAQEVLQDCTALEHLILPSGKYPCGELYTWVKAAQCVRVSDNDPEVLDPSSDFYHNCVS